MAFFPLQSVEKDVSSVGTQSADIKGYNSASNCYPVTSDGYIKMAINSSTVGHVIWCYAKEGAALAGCKAWNANENNIETIFVKKGMNIYFTISSGATANAYFIPLNY